MSEQIEVTQDEYLRALYRAGIEEGLRKADDFKARINTEYGISILADYTLDTFTEIKAALDEAFTIKEPR